MTMLAIEYNKPKANGLKLEQEKLNPAECQSIALTTVNPIIDASITIWKINLNLVNIIVSYFKSHCKLILNPLYAASSSLYLDWAKPMPNLSGVKRSAVHPDVNKMTARHKSRMKVFILLLLIMFSLYFQLVLIHNEDMKLIDFQASSSPPFLLISTFQGFQFHH